MRVCLLLLALLYLAGCASTNQPVPTQALASRESLLGAAVQRLAREHPQGQSGFRLLADNTEAFSVRAELIRAARRSLDLQYYIVHDGFSTRALVHELLQAADRGVRVRLLLDDTTSADIDAEIAVLAAHPQIHVRVFNPLHLGRSTGVTRTLGRLLNLSRQHRRMHNKLWLADSSVAIVGGRNLGDEYFDAKPDLNFTDIDLLGAGPVAEQLAHSFDQYWNSALSKPIQQFLWSPPTVEDLLDLRQELSAYLEASRKDRPRIYRRLMAYQQNPRLHDWLNELTWAHSQALWDAPSKVLARGEPDPQLLLTHQLGPELAKVSKELLLVSAYLVPADTGLGYLTNRADHGVAVSLLTNSLEATDVPAVHGGYAPYRKPLLEHGVKLFELRRQPDQTSGVSLGSSGSSNSSLHSKAMVFDRQKVFIGSLNLDPRSVLWNTEVGIVVDSRPLAEEVRALTLEGMSPAISYEVRLEKRDGRSRLVWIAEDDGRRHTLDKEPGGLWRRFNAWLSQAIGLEKML
ncbi:phospholipase D family protein [Pseudomonas indica]|uniref:phospholipase D family protein n=1 Tax=Pseudomonas indica TaxID=137658 RepID=UPI0023F6405E|nr:phospholipase D family protein [Pseudomonas indica]MBU3058882.1 phospholipase D family protein [Pseudomonas indica]